MKGSKDRENFALSLIYFKKLRNKGFISIIKSE